jgi:hypothetical protein
MVNAMNPPDMAGWNLALRFGLELGALAGLGAAAWHLSSGSIRWIAVIIVPVLAAIIWGVFNVLDDPSRSGAAPVEVAGWIRLSIELLILGAGAAGFYIAGQRGIAIAFAILVIFHYATTWSRIQWLLDR